MSPSWQRLRELVSPAPRSSSPEYNTQEGLERKDRESRSIISKRAKSEGDHHERTKNLRDRYLGRTSSSLMGEVTNNYKSPVLFNKTATARRDKELSAASKDEYRDILASSTVYDADDYEQMLKRPKRAHHNQIEPQVLQTKFKVDERGREPTKRLEDNERVRKDMERLRSENATLVRELEATRRREEEANSSVQRQAAELHVIKDEFRRAEAQHEMTRQLLEERTAELKDVQLFINQGDSLAGADVTFMVSSLNAEIFQSAAFMADSLDLSHGESWSEGRISKARENASRVLGEDFIKALDFKRVRGDIDFGPTLVQFTLQACITACCMKIVRAWFPGERDAHVMERTYLKIYQKESQAAAGRWRSMARAVITETRDIDSAVNYIVNRLIDVLTIAGCSHLDVQAMNIIGRFQERLTTVAKLATRLQIATGEEITSMEVVPYTFPSGAAFYSEAMDDVYEAERKSERNKSVDVSERVAGTVELGLMKVVKGAAGIQKDILVKAKVVLCSALQEGLRM